MRNGVCPNPPSDLQSRCLETIPATAIRRPGRSRLSLEMPSKFRLGWLGLMAAIPVVTVLAIVPMRKYLASRTWLKDKITTTAPTDFPIAGQGIRHFQLNATFFALSMLPRSRANWFMKTELQRVEIWDAKQGHYFGAWANGTDDPDHMRHFGLLELADGTGYQRTGDKVRTNLRVPEEYTRNFHAMVHDLFDPKHMTTRLTGYGTEAIHPDGTREKVPVVIEKRLRGVYAGAPYPKAVEVCVCVQRPPREMEAMGAPIIRVRFYRDLKTGLIYGYDMNAYWKDATKDYWAGNVHDEETPLAIGEGQFDYSGGGKSYRGTVLDKDYFLENARMLSDSEP